MPLARPWVDLLNDLAGPFFPYPQQVHPDIMTLYHPISHLKTLVPPRAPPYLKRSAAAQTKHPLSNRHAKSQWRKYTTPLTEKR